jgi:hypothetical protein
MVNACRVADVQKPELGKDACRPQGFYGPLTKDDVKVSNCTHLPLQSRPASRPTAPVLALSFAYLGPAPTAAVAAMLSASISHHDHPHPMTWTHVSL